MATALVKLKTTCYNNITKVSNGIQKFWLLPPKTLKDLIIFSVSAKNYERVYNFNRVVA